MTSFAFMFVEVPAPPWMTPTTNWSWSSPSMMRWHASSIHTAFCGVEHADLAVRAGTRPASPSASAMTRSG